MFDFLNYYTLYKSKGNIPFSNEDLNGQACFSAIFRKCRNMETDKIVDNEYSIYMYSEETPMLDDHYNNYCFLSKDDIKFHISYLRFLAPFKYRLNQVKVHERCAWKIDLKLSARPLVHIAFLTWVRYLYECPFSLAVYDALKLRKDPFFIKNSNYFNLVNLAIVNYSNDRIHQMPDSYSGYQQSYIMKSISRKQFKERIFSNLIFINETIDHTDKIIPLFEYSEWGFGEFLDNFEKRKETYINEINSLKK